MATVQSPRTISAIRLLTFSLYAVMKLLNEHMADDTSALWRQHRVHAAASWFFGHGRKRSAVMWAEHFASKPAVGEPSLCRSVLKPVNLDL